MENYLIYENFQEVISEVKGKMICDNCKFCYTWKNDGRFYRCENEPSKEVGIGLIPNPKVFGCINFEEFES